jgi:hypothetical protein
MNDLFYHILIFFTTMLSYSIFDYKLGDKVQGKYYLVHSIHNAIMTYMVLPDMYNMYFDFCNFETHESNLIPAIMTMALHIYHIILYLPKLRSIDWIHHILMVGIALPIALCYSRGSILNHSLFYTCGVPGCIDYMLLFLSRNNVIKSMTEKKINTWLNVWLRAPGCNVHTIFTIMVLNYYYVNTSLFGIIMIVFTAYLTYWNGNYFMKEAVIDYELRLGGHK